MTNRPIIAAVFTRDFHDAPLAGRVRTLALVQDALAENFDIIAHHIRPGMRSRRALLAQAISFLGALVRGQPLPLQVALFGTEQQNDDRARQILRDSPKAVYLDSVRSAGVLFALRRMAPSLRIVMDMDDLMSHRMAVLLRRRLPISLGYVAVSLPGPLRRILEGGFGKLFQTYERWALSHMERRICAAADIVTLVSITEVAILRNALPASTRATVVALPPPVSRIDPPLPVTPPIRFCFVGSDQLLQNRQTIDYLLSLWERTRPAVSLHIVGNQKRAPQMIAGVVWRGMVPDLKDVYTPGTVLISPSFVEGGIKTKVLEAFSYGVPALGNASSFDGMALSDYPLRVSEEELDDIAQHPQTRLADFERAARMGYDMLTAHHDTRSYALQWQSLLLPARESA